MLVITGFLFKNAAKVSIFILFARVFPKNFFFFLKKNLLAGKKEEIIGQSIDVFQGFGVNFIYFRHIVNISLRPSANRATDVGDCIPPAASRKDEVFQRRQERVRFIHFFFKFADVVFGNRALGGAFRLGGEVSAEGKEGVLDLPEEKNIVRVVCFLQQARDKGVQFVDSPVRLNLRIVFWDSFSTG